MERRSRIRLLSMARPVGPANWAASFLLDALAKLPPNCSLNSIQILFGLFLPHRIAAEQTETIAKKKRMFRDESIF